jgi:hypothetical protein
MKINNKIGSVKILFFEKSLEVYFFSQLLIIFGSLLFNDKVYESNVLPFLLVVNLISGILILRKHTKPLLGIAFTMCVINLMFLFSDFTKFSQIIKQISIFSLCLSYAILVTKSIIKQVWFARNVDRKVILGLMCGYISLGLIAFYLVLGVEILQPNSFMSTVHDIVDLKAKSATLMYYSYITLLTIGYGEIVPVTEVAQKISILIGLVGQFYMVILTGIIVGKYVNQKSHSN